LGVGYSQTGNAGRPSETIFVNPETTVIKLIKLINLPDDAYLVNKINLITIPANVPHIEIPAAITRTTKINPHSCGNSAVRRLKGVS